MTATDASEPAPPGPPPERGTQTALAATLLDAALQAQRAGSLDGLLQAHPLAARWMVRRHGRVVCGTLGIELTSSTLPQVAALLLRWLTTRLRPDGQPGFDGIGDEAWLHLSSWRPMLAVAAHANLLRIPDFPRQYRRRPDEAALDNLCGLWSVGPSTVYRMLDRARQAMAMMLVGRSANALLRLSLREMARSAAIEAEPSDAAMQRANHAQLAPRALALGDAASALWHHWQAADVAGFTKALRQRAGALCQEPETDALVERMAATKLGAREQVDLWIARAALARARNLPEPELNAYEQAVQVAQAAHQPLLLGIVQSALGKYYEKRDADRAFACYQDSAEFLRDMGPDSRDVDAVEHFMTTYVRLAWLYLLRNDPRAKAVLDRAETLRATTHAADDVLGTLEQCWAQYWRRAGDSARSLEHGFRALNIFERQGEQRSILSTFQNIAFDLAARGEFQRATEYSRRVLDAASKGGVEPDIVVGAYFNLGAIAFWKEDCDSAIADYQLALREALSGRLNMAAFRARYNLAEAHYTRFSQRADPADEAAGDGYIRDALAAPESDSSPAAVVSARELKAKLLGEGKSVEPNRMLPGEDAVHLAEMSEVHRHRAVLAVPGESAQHARAHLAIARCYAAIAAKEREAALALISRHELQAQFTSEIDDIRQTFQRELTREQQLSDAWKQAAADLVIDSRRAPLIAHLVRDGSISKSGYVGLCGVSPATASKHLGLLAERGLLVQRGKGPSTRYELPA